MRKFHFLFINLFLFSFTQAQLNIDFLGQINYDAQLSNLTGWADADGNEYAIVGTEDGTSIVDITNPTAPVEVQFVDGVNSIWREVRTWSNYAYVVTEGGGGMLCIDLSGLPGSVDYNFTDGGIGLSSGHTVFCDENGIVHVFGSNKGGGGDVMFDANTDPLNPEYIGEVTDWYIHDGYVRGDTLWAGNIYEGQFSVWDISDKASPELLATQNTPYNFTHNIWLTDDGHYLYTTDEVTNATVASYDVSDLTDIKKLDEFRANPGTNSIPHNVFVKGDFLVTAYYRDGVVITDALYPDILIKTGEYDTSPLTGNGFNGAWGCWAYLPSGNIIVSDMEEGLFILGPTYVHACYLSGNVKDAVTSSNLFDVTVDITDDPDAITTTNLIGYYATGTLNEGIYDVTFSKPGYESLTVTGVVLTSGDMVDLDVELEPLPNYILSGQVIDASSGTGVSGALVYAQGSGLDYNTTADASGFYSFPGIVAGDYNIYAGKWAYTTDQSLSYSISASTELNFYVNEGYYDSYILDYGWSSSDMGASSGFWVRDVPIGTFIDGLIANPDVDISGDEGNKCFMTGNGGGDAGTDDIDDGSVTLTSPTFDLSTYIDPHMNFEYWFQNAGGSGTPNDTMKIIIDNGSTTAVLLEINNSLDEEGFWLHADKRILDFISLSSTMQISITTKDYSPGHVCESAFDKFYIIDLTSAPSAAATADNASACEPATIEFTDMSSGSPASWNWTFEGGTPATSELQNPVITYLSPGDYDVSLTATNALGSSSVTLTDYITILDAPELSTTAGAGTATVIITGGTAPFDILWNDPLAQTTETAVDLPVGTYIVTVTDANGCKSSDTVNVQTDNITEAGNNFSVSLFPNPVISDLYVLVNYTSDQNALSYSLQDVTGKKIFENILDAKNVNIIDMHYLSSGLYTIKFYEDETVISIQKIIKQ